MADSSLNFEVRCWTRHSGDVPSIKSDLTRAIYETLGEAGIEIPFPQQDLHLRSVEDGILSQPSPPSNESNSTGNGAAE